MVDGNWERDTERAWNKVHILLELLIDWTKSGVLEQEARDPGEKGREQSQDLKQNL